MENSFILIHIPHSSLKLPKIFYKNIILNEEKINKENLELCDLYVDKLIKNLKVNKLIFKYSRLFCDVERFKDDNLESMSKIGMGFIYTHTSDKEKFINYSDEYKNYVINKYYDKHHNELDNLSNEIIDKYNKCLLVDLHSFSDTKIKKLLNLENNPDICIGVDINFEDKNITKFTEAYFKNLGYSVKINYPYVGTMVPNIFYKNKNIRFKSIMIEINKRVYLDDNKINEIRFNKFKIIIKEYIKEISKK